MNDPAPPKRKSHNSWASSGLDILGKVGLIFSSLLFPIVIFYHRPLNPWLPLCVLVTFIVSILFILIAAHPSNRRYRDPRKIAFGQIVLIVASFSSLGLLRYLAGAYRYRTLTNSELLLCALAIGVLTVCLWRITSNQRKRYKKELSEADVFVPPNIVAAVPTATGQRVLKASSSLFIVLGLVFGFVEVFIVYDICRMGNIYAVIIGAIPIPLIYAAICIFGNQKIVVGPDYLAYQRFGWQARAVNFKDVTKSRAHSIAAGKYTAPVLDVYTSDAKRPALRIPSGAFRQPDIQWLVSLPEMKFHR